MAPKPIRVAVLRFLWAPGPEVPGALPHLTWPDNLFHELFQASNGWSLRDYWLRSSFGLLQLEFDFSIANWWRFGDHTQAELMQDRQGMLAAARGVVEKDNGISLKDFDEVIAFVHAPPSNAGAVGGGAVFDQAGSIPFYQHELGHVLGFQHSFGPFLPPPNMFGSLYNDIYCVMGYTGPQAHAIQRPSAFTNTQIVAQDFWRSERRPSAAALYRRFTGTGEFVDSGWVAHVQPDQRVWIAALSEADNVTPVVAVLPVPGRPDVNLTVEYRTNVGDDAGVNPAVVIHSIGANDVGAGRGEVNPPWLESTTAPAVGNAVDVLGVRFEIATLFTGHPAGAEVQISPSRFRSVEEASTSVHVGAKGGREEGSHMLPAGHFDNDGPRSRLPGSG
jgi:hypothetical protein